MVATGTTGAGFEGELMALLASDPAAASAAEELVGDSVRYMATQVSSDNGTIPYLIDCKQADWSNNPLDTITYVAEGVITAWLRLPKLRPLISTAFLPTVKWLLGEHARTTHSKRIDG